MIFGKQSCARPFASFRETRLSQSSVVRVKLLRPQRGREGGEDYRAKIDFSIRIWFNSRLHEGMRARCGMQEQLDTVGSRGLSPHAPTIE